VVHTVPAKICVASNREQATSEIVPPPAAIAAPGSMAAVILEPTTETETLI